MKIILDTNIIFSDLLIKSAQVLSLERYLSITGDELCIPEVVIEETIRHFRKKYNEAQTNYFKAFQVLQIVGHEPSQLIGTDDAISDYRTILLGRLSELHARVLPLPKTQTKALLSRDIEERKPFDESGKGFRDALIWETILEECTQHEEKIIFISNDTDFISPSIDNQNRLQLHSDLINDLNNAGIPLNRIVLYKNLNQFNNDFIKPELPILYRDGDSGMSNIVDKINLNNIFTIYTKAIESKLQEKLPDLFNINVIQIPKVELLQWGEEFIVIEELDLGDGDIQSIVQASIPCDVKLYTNDNGLDSLYELMKNTIMISLDPRWEASLRMLDIKIRIVLIGDFIIAWESINNNVRSLGLLRIALNKEQLKRMRLQNVH